MFSDCCSHVLVQYTNEETKVYRTVWESGFAFSDIFTVFEREEGSINERDHYKSLDGKYSIDYSICGAWGIRNYDKRYENLTNIFLEGKDMWKITQMSSERYLPVPARKHPLSLLLFISGVNAHPRPGQLVIKSAQMKQDMNGFILILIMKLSGLMRVSQSNA